jgi:hypothetical protein
MSYLRHAAWMCGIFLFSACSPTFNWREVRAAQTPLVALFPCKPDEKERPVSLAGQSVSMTVLGCDAGGSTFSVAYADMKDAALVGKALNAWRTSTLGNIRSQPYQPRPFVLKGADVGPQSVQVDARGTRPNGSSVVAQAAWFAVGTQVFQITVFGEGKSPAETEAFLTGLRIQ